MITMTEWYAWLAIGAAAGLAGMTWPFRRGIPGAVTNLLLGMLGGLLGPFAMIALCGVSPEAPESLASAAGGALGLLALGHLFWFARVPHAHRTAHRAPRGG